MSAISPMDITKGKFIKIPYTSKNDFRLKVRNCNIEATSSLHHHILIFIAVAGK